MVIQRFFLASAINRVLKGLFSCLSKLLAGVGILTASVSAAVAGPSFPSWNRYFHSGNLVVTESVYAGYPSLIIPGSTILPNGIVATADGSYPNVFNNEAADPSFGVTAPIVIEQLTKSGVPVSRLTVPGRLMTSSFSSKSELAIHLSTDGSVLTFMGYVAPVNAFDVSNSNTPGHFDPSNPVPGTYQRAIGNLDAGGDIYVKPVDAYSGNNGRAAILHDWVYYLVGNAGNGTQKGAQNIVDDTGVQIAYLFSGPDTTVVGQQQGTVGASTGYQFGYSVTQDGYPPDNSGKDDNFRGITIFKETLYVTKGSGSNGINTVYQVGASGRLPSFATASTTRITILPGFSTTLANSKTGTVYHPFGLWFANPTTLYVADEGDGNLNNAATGFGGLQKWILSGGTWHLAYTLTDGLELGQPYTVAGYPTGTNPVTGQPWSPATDGLRNLTGKVNADGTVTIYAVTSTVSGATDQGADPNRLVVITDELSFTSAAQATGEQFRTLKTAASGTVLRGVAFAPSDLPED